MSLRVGFDHYTIAQRGLTPEETLTFAGRLGLEGVQFLEPASIVADLDTDALNAFARLASRQGLHLEVGLPSPNPVRKARLCKLPLDPIQHARDLIPHIHAVAALGCRHARAYVGDRHDRFRTDFSWPEQLGLTEVVLREMESALRDVDVKIAIETHADLTSGELLRWLDAFSDEWFGITLDTGNLFMRLDDPVEAAQRLAPRVLATHCKDAVLEFSPRGLRWQVRPLGEGAVPLAEIVAILERESQVQQLSIELHPRTYDMPIFDPSWLRFFPELTTVSLARIVQYASLCEQKYANGEVSRPEVVEAIPWSDRDEDWLIRSRDYLRRLLADRRGVGAPESVMED